MTQEHERLQEAREGTAPWKKWGPYLSERQWGTVREDYSDSGDAWDYVTHDQARSRAYRWGEDGIAGVSDNHQQLCFALALWNGKDPILKERLFGLSNSEGNHGEDVKEYYFYLDSTPTHSYMKMLYKYPQSEFPYTDLAETNRRRSRQEWEYELLDTGIFDQDRYFDVTVEYAKAGPEDLLVQISATNRGPEGADLHLLPTTWFRNTWSSMADASRPQLRQVDGSQGRAFVELSHPDLGNRYLQFEGDAPILFTENETNTERLFGQPSPGPYVKDGINDFVVNGRQEAINPGKTGTKAAAHYRMTIPSGETRSIRLRLTDSAPSDRTSNNAKDDSLGKQFEETLLQRQREADEFYKTVIPEKASEDEARVLRQALGGMLWTKQYYSYDLNKWLDEHQANPLKLDQNRVIRNRQWYHMVNEDIISMPDKWEYPWFAAWDLAFHTLALSMVDTDFSKEQLDLMLREVYLHPSGQLPAYEWNFGDVNPPVHAWAQLFTYGTDALITGNRDVNFLKQSFQKLLLNFTWWVNRKDRTGSNIFEGGFLGLDNIGIFDRSAPLPTGGYLDQADGTAWMALYCQNMLEIALELSRHDPAYGDMAVKFFEHFLWVASSMDRIGERADEMWDEEDGFFYDVLRLPDGSATRLKVRSMVGLLPVCASTVLEPGTAEHLPGLRARARKFLERNPELSATIAMPGVPGVGGRTLLSVVNENKLRRILEKMLDENEFLSPYGIRSLSRFHQDHPFNFWAGGQEYSVSYLPAESDSGMFGGNSNWRGPVWMPVNALLIRAMLQLYTYYGNDFTVECPTGSGRQMNLFQVAIELATRLEKIFLRDANGRRPVYGGAAKFQEDPHWRDMILFYEYFHGDNGAGLGASHQTGWTGVVARAVQLIHTLSPELLLETGIAGVRGTRPEQLREARAA